MTAKQQKLLQRILPFAVFGALWYLLIKHLAVYWNLNPQNSFGWFVPIISAYLFLIRWRTRPPVESAHSAVVKWVFWTAGFALLPTWLVEQPNPDWQLISWLLAFEIVALSLCAIYFLGGRSWLRHYAFSICFILVSVSWPSAVEDFIIQGLTQAATVVTVASLNLFHIPAVQHGNVIEVKTGLVGIDEACSGVRSLQATLMVSLFLGELYRASWLRRIVIVLCGAAIAFLCNVGRTSLLTAVAAKDGIKTISSWHDLLGFIVLAICLLLIWGFVRLVSGPIPNVRPSKETARGPFPWRSASCLGAWSLFTILGTEVWYRTHEPRETLHWSIEWPVTKKDFSDLMIPQPAADMLKFDEGRAASWTEGDGSSWTAFFFKWAAGPPRSRILARAHRPEVCLPAAGYKLRADRGTITIDARGLIIPFHALDFDYDGRQAHVFFCLWEDGLRGTVQPRVWDPWTRLARLETVLLGERNLGQQVLEIVIFGYATPQEAEAALRRDVEAMIQTTRISARHVKPSTLI
jgi:exosortase